MKVYAVMENLDNRGWDLPIAVFATRREALLSAAKWEDHDGGNWYIEEYEIGKERLGISGAFRVHS